SGLAQANPSTVTLGNGANQSVGAVTIYDVAGNSATSSAYSGINQDRVAPVIGSSITDPDAISLWYNIASGAAVVSYTSSDSGSSGLAQANPSTVTLGNGANQSVGAVTIYDVAGNSATSSAYSGINQDRVAPVIGSSITDPDAISLWYNIASGAAVVSYTSSDSGSSGLAQANPSIVTLGNGANQSVGAVTIYDVAGNSATSSAYSGINQDRTAPLIGSSITDPDAISLWYNIASGAAVVSYTSSDSGSSGLAQANPSTVTLGNGANQSVAAV